MDSLFDPQTITTLRTVVLLVAVLGMLVMFIIFGLPWYASGLWAAAQRDEEDKPGDVGGLKPPTVPAGPNVLRYEGEAIPPPPKVPERSLVPAAYAVEDFDGEDPVDAKTVLIRTSDR